MSEPGGTADQTGEPSPEAILNAALAMELEWGDPRENPRDARLKRLYPGLSNSRVTEIFLLCSKVGMFGTGATYHLIMDETRDPSSALVGEIVRVQYPWVNDENISRMYSTGAYSAARDGVLR